MGDRYRFDFHACKLSNGWAQLDTRQDASYYGNWISPGERKLVSYCEGDVTVTTCDDDAEFAAYVNEAVAWHTERGYFIGIDAGGVASLEAAFDRLWLGDYLHGRSA